MIQESSHAADVPKVPGIECSCVYSRGPIPRYRGGSMGLGLLYVNPDEDFGVWRIPLIEPVSVVARLSCCKEVRRRGGRQFRYLLGPGAPHPTEQLDHLIAERRVVLREN